MDHIIKIAGELNVRPQQVKAVVELLDGGATVPFISRYRKEMTAILKSIKEQEKLTPELEKEINAAETMAKLEDIYLPYKPKRRTKATIAREKGLEPLAKLIFEQGNIDIELEAGKYIDEEKEVADIESALHGARDIIAEWANENAELREDIRELFLEKGKFRSKVLSGKETEGQKYKDYFEWEENVKTAPSHRILAMRRGEKEMILMLDISPEEEDAIFIMEKHFVKADNEAAQQVKMALADAYKRLLKPSMETEIRIFTKKKDDTSTFVKRRMKLAGGETLMGMMKDKLKEAKKNSKMSGGMAMGGGHKNYKMTGTLKAKTGKLVGNQKKLPKHLQKAILA